MPLSRNQSKSAENLRCQRNIVMYFQLTRRSVLRYLIVRITNKFIGINTPMMRPRLHSPPTTAAGLTLVCLSYHPKEQ